LSDSKIISTEEYIKKLNINNKAKNINIKLKEGTEYKGCYVKILHICSCRKDWMVSPTKVLSKNKPNCGLCHTFTQWGIDNLGEDFLEKYWDYEKNTVDPWKINYNNSSQKVYIKCQEKDYHGSYPIRCSDFCKGNRCGYCKGDYLVHPKDSFGQFLIDSFGITALELYWDYDKNTIDPFKHTKYTNRKVWIYCQEKGYHGSYNILCGEFVRGGRCGYCNSRGKVHILDSLGTLYPQVFNIWSDRNKKSPYEYTYGSNLEVWFKCENKKHDDYPRKIYSAKSCNFRCPECVREGVESKMATTLKQVFKHEYLNTIWEYDIGFRTDKNGISRYDIFVPELNLLVECQSEYHDDDKHKIRDKLKKQFAINNGYTYFELDNRDYSPLEAVQLFFPNIKEIPIYIEFDKNTLRNWDLEYAQKLLNNGYSFMDVANEIGINYKALHNTIMREKLIKPQNYHIEGVKIVCLSKENELVKIYNSVDSAAQDLGASNGTSISSCLTKKPRSDTGKIRKTAFGYKWMYYEDYKKLFFKDNINIIFKKFIHKGELI